MLTIALTGRPNVGKSTLYNRLANVKHAIVQNTPGVTRDWREGVGNIGPLNFKLLDTAGLDKSKKEDELSARMVRQTEMAISHADIILFIVDAKAGVTPVDEFFAKWIRKQNKPVILVVNKCENRKVLENSHEYYSLGFGEAVYISAEHGEGMAELYYKIDQQEILSPPEEIVTEEMVQIAIVGKPNAGKSTLINKLLKQDRMLTGPEAGITRDSISIKWQYKNQSIKLIDTAGMRRKIADSLEKMSYEDSMRAIQYANIVVLLIDVTHPLEKQDLNIASHVIKEGRAIILAFNKCDQLSLKELKALQQEIEYRLHHSLGQISGLRTVYLSALKGENVYKLIDECLEIYEKWNIRIPTAKLNGWLKIATEEHLLPLSKTGRRARIKYATQINIRPPSFALFSNYQDIDKTYIRYLTNSLSKYFSLEGVPIRILVRKSDNPYEGK